MRQCEDCTNCFYCDRFVSPRHEHDHFPIPRRAGDLSTFMGREPREAMALLVALADSMPEPYPSRITIDEVSVTLRPITDWSTAEPVRAVISASTTEARLYLAKALACSWDWRSNESALSTVSATNATYLRPRQDGSGGATRGSAAVPRQVRRIDHAPRFLLASRSTTTGRSSSCRLRSLIRSR